MKRQISKSLCILFSIISANAQAIEWPSALVSKMDNAASAISKRWVEDHDPEDEPWAWGEGVLAYGLVKAAEAQNNDEALNWLNTYIDYHDEKGKVMEWSDHLSPAISALYISKNLDPNQEIKGIAEDVIEYIMTAPRSQTDSMLIHLGYRQNQFPYNVPGYPEAWVDSLFHITSNLVLYSELVQDNTYMEEAIYQVETIIGGLQDPATGLVAHAKFDNDVKTHEVPRWENNEFWARGNGWALVSLVELLTTMPQSHPSYPRLLERTQRLEQALRQEQGSDGRFHTLVTKTSTYYETAATALILYGMAKGVEAGIFHEDTEATVIKGAEGLLNKTLRWNWARTEASVRYTSIGTNPDPGLYRWVPRQSQVNYGVGAWLMLAAEIIN